MVLYPGLPYMYIAALCRNPECSCMVTSEDLKHWLSAAYACGSWRWDVLLSFGCTAVYPRDTEADHTRARLHWKPLSCCALESLFGKVICWSGDSRQVQQCCPGLDVQTRDKWRYRKMFCWLCKLMLHLCQCEFNAVLLCGLMVPDATEFSFFSLK